MDARYLAAMLIGLTLAGCSSGGNTELMERELRLQEDRIYYLEDELARCCEAMQCAQADLASQGGQPPAASRPTTRRSGTSTNSAPAELPKVELELPDGPAPLNSLPSLFDPATPGDDAKGTAMRIVKPAPQVVDHTPLPEAVTNGATSPAPRMRFASTVDGNANTGPSRVVMQWSAPTKESAAVEPVDSTPHTATLPRRPQWAPYR